MLTVRYEELGLNPGERLLDLGCGFGRHAFEGLRQGATVVAFDYALEELKQVRATYGAMYEAGEVPTGATAGAVRGDAHRLPFPDACFDRVIASEVIEHLPDDSLAVRELARVLRPGGTIAITVPARFPETVCWKLSEEYHAPIAVGGHLRIYPKKQITNMMENAGLAPYRSHKAHALHSPYWWLKCAVGPTNDENQAVKAYHKLLTWDIMKAPAITRRSEQILNPLLGKSIAVYARKPVKENAGG
ncbi:MAG: class I SAM-dependent methyltransferase [Acidimicrobiia bacterium]